MDCFGTFFKDFVNGEYKFKPSFQQIMDSISENARKLKEIENSKNDN